MGLSLAFAVLVAVILTHYGYYFIPGNNSRIFYAMNGLQGIALASAMIALAFRRITDWRVSLVLICAFVISCFENMLVFVCGSWYAFIYEGPILKGDKCENMLGMTISKPLAFAIFTTILMAVPRIWNKKWPRKS